MAHVFNSPEELEAYLADDYELVNEIDCPRCGSAQITILQMPRPESWFGRTGRASCEHCRLIFAVEAIDESTETEE